MKTVFFSDVHGVATAFRAFLREVKREAPDQVVFLGDLLTLGPSPIEVAELYFQQQFVGIEGNHDEFLGDQTRAAAYTKDTAVLESIEWTKSVLNRPVLDGVAGFSPTRRVDLGHGTQAFCYHGTPESNTEILTEGKVDSRLQETLTAEDSLCLGGHIHMPFLVRRRGVLFANAGSCGMPFFDPSLPGLPRLLPRADFVVVDERFGPAPILSRGSRWGSMDFDRDRRGRWQNACFAGL